MKFAEVVDLSSYIMEFPIPMNTHLFGVDAKLFGFVFEGESNEQVDSDLQAQRLNDKYPLLTKVDHLLAYRDTVEVGLSYLIDTSKLVVMFSRSSASATFVLLLPISESQKSEIVDQIRCLNDFNDVLILIVKYTDAEKILFGESYIAVQCGQGEK